MHLCKYFNLCASSILCSKSWDIVYKAQSQDEDALVHAAAQLHMVFFNKSGNILGKDRLFLAI